MKEDEELREKIRKEQQEIEEKEDKKLKEVTNELRNLLPIEIELIENEVNLKFKEVIYDSKYCDWSMKNSTFDKRLLGKKYLMFRIETKDEQTIGGFIFERIDLLENEIADSNAFLFFMNENKLMEKFEIKTDGEKHLSAFNLYSKDKKEMFSFGSDLFVFKNDFKQKSYGSQSCYDLRGYTNPFMLKKKLMMKDEEEEKIEFEPTRIQVFQFQETNFTKMKNNQLTQNRINEENKKLKEITEDTQQNMKTEIRCIQKWTSTRFKEVIFDSECCDWSTRKSTFDQRILGKEKLVFIIEDDNENMFGGFIENQIDVINDDEKDEEYFRTNVDRKSFVFSLKSDETESSRFPIQLESSMNAFILENQNAKTLFRFGLNDIKIYKKHYHNKSYCEQTSFNYDDDKNVLTGKEGKDEPFGVKHIQVWQMTETDKQKKTKERKEKEIEDERIQEFEQEKQKIKENSETLMENRKSKIKQVEKWTNMKCEEIVFDNEYCSHGIYSSTFDLHIMNREKLAFIFDCEFETKCGCYINEKIDKYSKPYKNEGIIDSQSFMFTFGSKNSKKFDLKENCKDKVMFKLFDNKSDMLVSIGNDELIIRKKELKSIYNQHEECIFDYGNEQLALMCEIDKRNYQNKDINKIKIDVSRVMVLQMREKNEEELEESDSEEYIEKFEDYDDSSNNDNSFDDNSSNDSDESD